MSGHPRLLERIRREILDQGPISFARFMELALYDPEFGYYARSADRLGPQGDFFTASDAGRAFGRSMARQILEVDRLVGPFDPFHVIEFGAGRGLLARDTTEAAAGLDRSFASRLRYLMVERSPAMHRESQRTVPQAKALSPQEVGDEYRGCLLAVELFDALPVHRVRRHGGELVEVRVDMNEKGQLVEHEAPPSAEVAELAERYGAAADEGVESEVCPAARSQLDAMERIFDRGVVIIVDYGYPAEELYSPERERGTLLAYHRHATNEDYLERVGEQDLTAHVNFTALEDRARELGLDVLGRTTQDRFLIANGLLEIFDEPDSRRWQDPRHVKQRLQAKQLVQPTGMGRTFKVLLLSKGCQPPPDLQGLRDPFGAAES